MYRERDPASDFDDFVCPRCRFPVTVPHGELPPRPSCPRDGWPLIRKAAFEKSDGDPLLGARLEGEFVALELAATGASSAIYRGRGPHDELVALKVVRVDGPLGERGIEAWQREVEVLEGWEATSIVRMLDAGRVVHPPGFFVALEWLEGESLGAHLGRSVAATELDDDALPVLDLALAITWPLRAVHARGLVHADFKPENLMLAELAGANGEPAVIVKLVDFGATVASGVASPLVSASFASPEQLAGDPLDPRADVYAFGCVLHALLTGAAPFVGERDQVVSAHATARVAPPTERLLPAARVDLRAHGTSHDALDSLCLALLEKDPGRRPSSIAEVQAELTRLR